MIKDFPITVLPHGVERKVLSESSSLMVVAFRFIEAGIECTVEPGAYVRSTFVRFGRFRFEVDDKVFEAGPGKSFVVPPETKNRRVCLEPGELIDTFSPPRDEFL